jgi:hypothetical protein
MQVLIVSRPDASNPDLSGSPMSEAAVFGHLPAMQLLVQHGADVHNSRAMSWSSTVVASDIYASASVYGQLSTFRWLHAQGMTVDEVGRALVVAAGMGHVPIIHYLMQECGANVSLYGPEALRLALQHGRWGVVCLLLEAGTPTDDGAAFMQAAQRCVTRFNPEQFDTILQAATQHGHTQLADMLRGLRAAAS